MKILIGILIVFGLGFILGQESIMSTFDPNDWYESSMQLGRLSYEMGCDDGTLDLTLDRCKEMSRQFETKLRATKVK